MHYEVIVAVSADRDPDCNLYTYTETFALGLDHPRPDQIQRLCESAMSSFDESWPFQRINKPVRPNVDAVLRLVK